eukprot:CAMPEP_0185767376 /NCGR_PEP_ID=MMETSP1174-20130828/42641_1 /TAXON_ID=35687 /ORGANISM="Dictyocha speculum, Strain CCMP1381" /LENGTH=248 /DNA_ID=CAMNT_0028451533 /DNA_START=46 /DNA_END=792 /DNA_ORIENTATION=-
MEDLAADVEELSKLRSMALRPRSIQVLDEAITKVEKTIANIKEKEQADKAAAETPAEPTPSVTLAPKTPPPTALSTGDKYISISSFGWDSGEYNTPWVNIYISLPGVGAVKDKVECNFDTDNFDLRVHGLAGKNYRLIKDNLDKDIVPAECKKVVKKDRIVLKLKKVKGDYSYDSWTNLVAKKEKAEKQKTKADPMGGIMDMMKDMYEDGDDNMKKIIAESMMKARSGDKSGPGGADDLGMGGIGGME